MRRGGFAIALFIGAACLWSGAGSLAEPSRSSPYVGQPFFRAYGDVELGGEAVGHFLAKSPDGLIYFGNDRRTLFFDGFGWNSIVRDENSLAVLTSMRFIDGQVFTGSFQEAGTLMVGERNELVYALVVPKERWSEAGDRVKQILPMGDRVIFRGSRGLVIYDPATGQSVESVFDSWIELAFTMGDTVFVSLSSGVLRVDEDGGYSRDLLFANFYGERIVRAVVELPGGGAIIGTQNGGVFRMEDGVSTRIFESFDFSKYVLMDMALVGKDAVAVALQGRGVIVFGLDGEMREVFDSRVSRGLINPSALLVENENTIWTMLDSSVMRLIVGQSLSEITLENRPALNYPSLHDDHGDLVIRSENALYRSRIDGGSGIRFEKCDLPGEGDWVYGSCDAPDGIYLTNGQSIILYRNSEIVPLVDALKVNAMYMPRNRPDLLLCSNDAEFILFRREGDSLTEISRTRNAGGFAYGFAESNDGNIWVENGTARATLVTIEEDSIRSQTLTSKDGLPAYWITTWENEGEVYLVDGTGPYRYDAATNRYSRSDKLDRYFPKGSAIFHRLKTDPNGNIYASVGDSTKVLWKQPDGTYEVDAATLGEMGENHMHYVYFHEGHSAFFLSAHRMFHLRLDRPGISEAAESTSVGIYSIRNHTTGEYLYQRLSGDPEGAFELLKSEDDLEIRLFTAHARSTKIPLYRWELDGNATYSGDWSSKNEFSITNIPNGEHRLRFENRVGGSSQSATGEIDIVVVPDWYASWWAIAIYAAILAFLGYLGNRIASAQLRKRNLALERVVFERTHETEEKNRQLARTLGDLKLTQDQLLLAARKTGMAEIAINVLHNVGNVLNSINVSVGTVGDRLNRSSINRLRMIANLVNERRDDLPSFLANDPKGKAVPDYLKRLSKAMEDEFRFYQSETVSISENLEHMKRIIATQQEYARSIRVVQTVQLEEAAWAAISMIIGTNQSREMETLVNIPANVAIESDKHRIIQVLTNLVKNAKEAISASDNRPGRIRITGGFEASGEFVSVSIQDNGIGVKPEHLSQIFNHGFSTKKDGHGFGMHSCANTIKELGGEIRIESDGEQLGAIIVIRLPRKAQLNPEEN